MPDFSPPLPPDRDPQDPTRPSYETPSAPPRPDTASAFRNELSLQRNGIVVAEIVADRPQLWPVFVGVAVAILAAMGVSVVTMVLVIALTGPHSAPWQAETLQLRIGELARSPYGLAVLVLPGQLTFAATAFAAAAFSRQPWRERLGLQQGRFPVWSWPLFLFGTPVIGMMSSWLMSALHVKPSDELKMLEELLRFDSAGSLVMVLLLVSLLPGIAEELLFRGFMQRRLLQRMAVVPAIAITSIFFAAAHMDPLHAVTVLPLGIWLGIVAWRADSLWPAMLGHMGNNAYAIVMAGIVGSSLETPDVAELEPVVLVMVLVSTAVCFGSFAGAVAMLNLRGADPASQPAKDQPPPNAKDFPPSTTSGDPNTPL